MLTPWAVPWLGSDNIYNRYMFDARFYFPVIKTDKTFRAWMVWRSRVQVGYIHSSQPNGVPIFERYFPGGIFSDGGLRGYRLRTLGPKIVVRESPDPTAVGVAYPVGGNLLTAMNNELEFMMVPAANIKGLVFFDIGNAFNTEGVYCANSPSADQLPKADPCGSFGFANLRYSTGFGFRWQSPIGPLRFEWGFPLDRILGTELLPSEDPVVFEFNVGTGF